MDAKKAPDKDATALDLRQIRQIVALMSENDLSYFHFENEGSRLELRRGSDFKAAKQLLKNLPMQQAAAPQFVSAPAAAAPQAAATASAPGAAPADASASSNDPMGPTINSPMVGTFYRASGPGEKAFANVGDSVDDSSTVCIIEAMKVMNEIKAEIGGTIARILVEDGKPVQYGQPLFELKA